MGNKEAKKDKLTIEKCRQELSKKYKAEISELNSEIKKLREENESLKDKIREHESEMEAMKEWLERMQDYTNLSDEELKELVKKAKLDNVMVESIDSVVRGPLGYMFESLSKFYGNII
ncbi:MAG: hypothetical protein J6A59_01675 [Lachnospiraceae bacterium]|nr:hypothetical protein [Lachnospiraceae bacterium]